MYHLVEKPSPKPDLYLTGFVKGHGVCDLSMFAIFPELYDYE